MLISVDGSTFVWLIFFIGSPATAIEFRFLVAHFDN